MHTFIIRWKRMHIILLSSSVEVQEHKKQGKKKGGLISMLENVQHTCRSKLKTTHLLQSQHRQFHSFHSYLVPTVQMPAATSRWWISTMITALYHLPDDEAS